MTNDWLNQLGPFLEHWLGPALQSQPEPDPVTIARFDNAPFEGCISLVTLTHDTESRFFAPDMPVRQELLIAMKADQLTSAHAPMLQSLRMWLTEQGEPLRYGQALTFDEKVEGTDMAAFYVSAPVYFPQAMAFHFDAEPPTQFLWLIPITEAEAEFLLEEGEEPFQELLTEFDPDMTDWSRDSLV